MPSLTLPARDLELHLPHLHPLQHPPHHHNASHTQLALPFPSPTSHPQAAPITAPGATSTMPTPESELFLAKKPKVAPTFEGVDYDDNVALKAAQDAIIRENHNGRYGCAPGIDCFPPPAPPDTIRKR